MTTERPRTFGWCDGNDRHHALCRVRYVTQFGVERVCECPNHEETE